MPHSPSAPISPRRVAWLVATRGDVLLLGPLFMELRKQHLRHPDFNHWLLDTGETGMAVHQARDLLGLIPDETAELCHPADEPAVRLALMLERAESFIRRRKGSHVIFSGCGPTAAATAIYCHARGCRALWLRPPDPAGILPRLRWESGLERIIRACAPVVQAWQIPAVPDWRALAAAGEGSPASLTLETEIPELRPGAPLVLITVLRREWGTMDDATERLARGAAAWAAARPGADFLIVSNLNARLEGPVRSHPARPANMLLVPPLPYPLYDAALARARLVLTDSPLVAAQALARGVPLATLGDLPPATPAFSWPRALCPEDLSSDQFATELLRLLDAAPGELTTFNDEENVVAQMRLKIQDFLEK